MNADLNQRSSLTYITNFFSLFGTTQNLWSPKVCKKFITEIFNKEKENKSFKTKRKTNKPSKTKYINKNKEKTETKDPKDLTICQNKKSAL